MRVSKFIKPNKDILIEYVYDDGNNISEGYKIVQNLRDNTLSYVGDLSTSTNNSPLNQLLQLDPVTNNYGLLNTTTYAFIQLRDYSSGFPNRHDTIKVHLPINYTFGEYLGFYLKVFTFDLNNSQTKTLSNFYFDLSNVEQSSLLSYNSPAFLFQEKLWGKNVTIMVPSTYAISRQRVNDSTKPNSINAILTDGLGLSLTSPVFLDFHFINQKRIVNAVTTYNLTAKVSMSIPQAPDFENIGVKIQHASNGDYFEIFGTFNGDVNQFDNFIQNAVSLGNRYYATYTITLFEQNIRGKSFTITVNDNFNERIEYRPIIKFSTTTAIIDVEMNLIDAVDESSIYRKSSYGLLQDEVSKYSINLTKINITNALKPKIYNIKSPEGAGIFGNKNSRVKTSDGNQKIQTQNGISVATNQVTLEPVRVNYAVLTNMFSVVAKSDNVTVGKDTFYGLGKLELLIQPFDNIIKLKIAKDISQLTTATALRSPSQVSASIEYMDMTNMGEIKFVAKNQQILFETTLLISSNEVDLVNGIVVFRIPASKIPDLRKISDSGYNLFYVTSTTDSGTVVAYSGIYAIYDTPENAQNLRNQAEAAQLESSTPLPGSEIIDDPNLANRQGTALVTLDQIPSTSTSFGSTSSETSASTSVESSLKFGGKTYTIDSRSNLIINGYTWTNSQIKEVLALDTTPIQLSFKTDGLYSFGKYLSKLVELNNFLENKYVKTLADREQLNSVQGSFLDNQTS